MKKLSLLMALAMFITIGGVYASWHYQNATIEPKHTYFNKIQLTEIVPDGEKGAIRVNHSGLVIEIDDANDDKAPELVVKGTITIYYTPAADNVDVPDLYYHLGMSNPALGATNNHVDPVSALTFKGDSIFTTYNTANHKIDRTQLVSNGDGSYVYTIDEATLQSYFAINTDIVLSTYQDYLEYNNALAAMNYGITVGEYVETVIE